MGKNQLHRHSFILLIFSILVTFSSGATAEMQADEKLIFDFERVEDTEGWRIINDGVMGGISQSEIIFTKNGTVVFQGTISLENNGGFASTRTSSLNLEIGGFKGIAFKIRGDGKGYQLRLRTDNSFDGVAYRYRFSTQSGSTQIIRAPFSNFEPVFRGRIVANSNPLLPESILQIGLLIADNQVGSFRIEIEWLKAYR